MTITDVNEAFRAERLGEIDRITTAAENARAAGEARAADFAARVAEGKMRDLGNGQFQVTDPGNWDDGEVWTLTQRDGVELVLPQHGLDEQDGKVALYTSTPMWHGVGTVIPGGISSIDRVIELAGLDWEVKVKPAHFPWETTTGEGEDAVTTVEWLPHPGKFHTVREDTREPLGAVGAFYANDGVIQNRQAFQFLQELVAETDGGVIWESAGALKGGRRVFVTMRLPEDIVIELEPGAEDTIRPFIAAINAHDGLEPFRVVATPWRIGCGNTERFAIRDAVTSWTIRHGSGATKKLDEARRSLKLAQTYMARWGEDEQALTKLNMTPNRFEKFLDEVYPLHPESKTDRAVKLRNERLDVVRGLYAANAETLGKTGYAAERAVTEFSDWKRGLRPSGSLKNDLNAARATAVLLGEDDTTKSKAHSVLMRMVGGGTRRK